MSITIDFSPDSMTLIRAQASSMNMSVEDFIRKASEKAARNAEYLAMLDRGFKQADEGTGTYFTDEELRELIYGNKLRRCSS